MRARGAVAPATELRDLGDIQHRPTRGNVAKITKMWTTRAVIVALLAAATLTSTGHAVSTPTAGLLDDNALAVERSVPGFAGTWVDGGTLVVASTRGTGALAGQARHELARLLGRPDFASLPVAVRPARYTFGERTGGPDAVSHAGLGRPGWRGCGRGPRRAHQHRRHQRHRPVAVDGHLGHDHDRPAGRVI